MLYAVILVRLPEPGLIAIGLSLSYIAYYGALSVYLTVTRSQRMTRRRSPAPASSPGSSGAPGASGPPGPEPAPATGHGD